jgi:hypothetical protein
VSGGLIRLMVGTVAVGVAVLFAIWATSEPGGTGDKLPKCPHLGSLMCVD